MTETKIPVDQLSKDKLRRQILNLVDEYARLEFAPKNFVPGQTAIPPSGKLIGVTELPKYG
jgi:CDP-6-deoxy-D-xylo-4-hexulose-3-dehydrase